MTGEPNPTESADLPTFNPFEPGFAEDPVPASTASSCATQPGAAEPARPVDALPLRRLRPVPARPVAERGGPQRRAASNPRAELREQILGDRPQRGTRSILNIDPPDHTRIRGIVQKVFTPRAIEQLAPRVQALVDDALDAVVARGDGAAR